MRKLRCADFQLLGQALFLSPELKLVRVVCACAATLEKTEMILLVVKARFY